jgi:hypothetical protein
MFEYMLYSMFQQQQQRKDFDTHQGVQICELLLVVRRILQTSNQFCRRHTKFRRHRKHRRDHKVVQGFQSESKFKIQINILT